MSGTTLSEILETALGQDGEKLGWEDLCGCAWMMLFPTHLAPSAFQRIKEAGGMVVLPQPTNTGLVDIWVGMGNLSSISDSYPDSTIV